MPPDQAAEVAVGTLMLQSCWHEQDLTLEVAPPENIRHLAIFCDLAYQDGVEAAMTNRLAGTRCLFLHADAQDMAARFQSYVARILTEIKNLIANAAEDPAVTNLIQVVVPHRDETWPMTGLAGLLQTARLEHPTLVGQLIAVDPQTDAAALAEILERECRVPSERRVRYDAGPRRVAGWREMATSVDTRASTPPWRQGATYLITGGAGRPGAPDCP